MFSSREFVKEHMKRASTILVILISLGLQANGQSRTRKTINPVAGKGEIRGVFWPSSSTDADSYFIYIRKYQEMSFRITSNSVFLQKDNECGMYFRLFDDKGIETKLGDAPAGVDQWSGNVEKAGTYRIQIAMGCLESVSSRQIAAKKPRFSYTLKTFQPPAPSR